MEVLVSDIKTKVRTVIDEIAPNDAQFLGTQDEAELDTIINNRLCEAVDFVHGGADRDLLAGDAYKVVSVGSGVSVDVTDMLRFISGKKTGWSRSVTELTIDGSEEYAIALDEYVGASTDRPAALITLDESSGAAHRKLQLMPTGQTGKIFYIEKCEIKQGEEPVEENSEEEPETYDYVNIDKLMVDAVVNYLAGLVLMTLNDDRGENLIKLATNMIGVEEKG